MLSVKFSLVALFWSLTVINLCEKNNSNWSSLEILFELFILCLTYVFHLSGGSILSWGCFEQQSCMIIEEVAEKIAN